MRRTLRTVGSSMLVGLFVVVPAPVRGEDGERDFEGSVEVLYRNVSQSGSSQKYDEDFDGLDSGLRLSNLRANWNHVDSGLADFLRLEANNLGGDPYERAAFRMGRKDAYDFSITHSKQSYLYNLFELVDDQDGSTWDSERRLTDVSLKLHATETIDLFFEFQEVGRDGTSLFMKDVNTDLFRLETQLDQTIKRYSVGGRFEIGAANLLFRQTLRRYDYRFNNTTEGDAGLSATNPATLNEYDWLQSDTGGADLTTLTVSLPLGDRVDLTATVFGTLIGEEEITSRVSLEADGTSSTGGPFSVTDGASAAEIEADHLVLDAEVSVKIRENLDFHFQFRTLDREIIGSQSRDLDGNGLADDTEGTVNDATPGSITQVDYGLDSITGLFDFAPSPKVRFRAGYRTVSRELDRSGFEYGGTDYRDTDFESDDDGTIILGLVLEPVRWFRLNADYEDAEFERAFTAVAPREADHLRLRARFLPRPEMRLDLSYLDYENSNSGVDFRDAGDCAVPGSDVDDGCWNSRATGTTYSAFFWHKPDPNLDYWLRWAQQDVDSVIRMRVDTEIFFGSAENADSIYDNTSTEWSGQINFSWAEPWRAFVRARVNDSDGNNDVVGPTFTSNRIIDQDYSDVEAGVTYAFSSGLYVGGRFRVFDYEDDNDRLGYDGEIFSIVAGLAF